MKTINKISLTAKFLLQCFESIFILYEDLQIQEDFVITIKDLIRGFINTIKQHVQITFN